MNEQATTDISEYLALVDKEIVHPEQFNYEVTREGIRHFAYAVNDHNALYLDEEYARGTSAGGIIAPPGYLYSHGQATWIRTLGNLRDSEGRVLSQNDNAGEEWEFFQPVRPGDFIILKGKASGAITKQGRKTGHAAIVSTISTYTNQRNELVARVVGHSFRFNPVTVIENGGMAQSYPKLAEGQTTRDPSRPPGNEFFRETPARRRDPQLYFEDVTEGMAIPTWDFGQFGTNVMSRWSGATSSVGQWSPAGAQQGGVIPDTFAPGIMRTAWFGTMLTRWGGPNSWVRKLSYQNREWILAGYKPLSKGNVTGKFEEDGKHIVECEVWCENDLGNITNTGSAQLELPSRKQS